MNEWNNNLGEFISELKGKTINDNIEYFIEEIRRYDLDIICLQEIHYNTCFNQIEFIAQKVGMNYIFNHMHTSHIESGFEIGIGILSKHTITNLGYKQFLHPNLEKISSTGIKRKSFDKGVLFGEISIENIKYIIGCTYFLQFHRFNEEMGNNKYVYITNEIEKIINQYTDKNTIICGDMNYNEIKNILPGVFEKGFKETFSNEVSTPFGNKLDHINNFR